MELAHEFAFSVVFSATSCKLAATDSIWWLPLFAQAFALFNGILQNCIYRKVYQEQLVTDVLNKDVVAAELATVKSGDDERMLLLKYLDKMHEMHLGKE